MLPLVSVVTITYNHAPYIAKCLEGVLMQQVDFPMELIIADDCSIDGTRELCEEYAAKYPERIRLITSDTNLGAVENERRAFRAAKGKYIATCEGDDYWNDPQKLQLQVEFLEAHPDYSVCFHRYKIYYVRDNRYEDDDCAFLFENTEEKSVEISMYQFMHRWVTQYLTMVFRRDCYDSDLPDRYNLFRDTHQMYHLLLRGKCRLFSFVGGVYNITGTGVYSDMDALQQEQMVLAVDKELWKVNDDKRWYEMCSIVMQDMIDVFASSKQHRTLLLGYSWKAFCYNHLLKKLLKNVFRIL